VVVQVGRRQALGGPYLLRARERLGSSTSTGEELELFSGVLTVVTRPVRRRLGPDMHRHV
jgi:hypothetical protein